MNRCSQAKRRWVPAAVFVLVAVVIAWWSLPRRGHEHNREASGISQRVLRAPDGVNGVAVPPQPSVPAVRRISSDARERLGWRLKEARARRVAIHRAVTGPTQSDLPSDDEPLEKEYVRDRIRDVVPLVAECYQLALHRDPNIGGRLDVEFAITGEPDVGGVIESSEIRGTSTISDAELRECVSETMFALEMKPPQQGGRVVVRYPFTFDPKFRTPPPGAIFAPKQEPVDSR